MSSRHDSAIDSTVEAAIDPKLLKEAKPFGTQNESPAAANSAQFASPVTYSEAGKRRIRRSVADRLCEHSMPGLCTSSAIICQVGSDTLGLYVSIGVLKVQKTMNLTI